MARVKIIPPSGDGIKPGFGAGTKVVTESGADIANAVSRMSIHIAPDCIIEAKIDIAVDFVDIKADAIFSLDSVHRLARLHGYDLVKR